MPPQRQTSPSPHLNSILYWFCQYCQKNGRRAKNGYQKHLRFCSASQQPQAIPVDEIDDKITTETSEEITPDTSSPGWSSDQGLPASNDADFFEPYQAFTEQSPPEQCDTPPLPPPQGEAPTKPVPTVPKVTTSIEPPSNTLGPFDVHTQLHPCAVSTSRTSRSHAPRHESLESLIWPFKSIEDLRQTQLLLESEVSALKMDKQLQFSYELQGADKRLTIKSSREMYKVLDKGTIFEEGLFEKQKISTSYAGHKLETLFHCRNIMHEVRELLEDPELANLFALNAEREFVRHPDGTRNMQVYREYYQCDDFWDIQTAIGPETSPLILMLYCDGTQLTAFGNNSLSPIFMWIANLPAAIRASHGKGGATLIGYMPEVPDIPGAKDMANIRSAVYHDCLHFLFSSIGRASRSGESFTLGRRGQYHMITVVGVTPSDYIELCKLHCNIGLKGPCACPICLVPKKSLPELSKSWPLRDQIQTNEIIANARKNVANTITPKEVGLRPIKNAFNVVSGRFFSIHRLAAADVLHWIEQGIYGRGFLPKLIKMLQDKKTRGVLKKIDKRFKTMRRYPGLTHFAQGVTSLKWRSGSDHAAISKLLTPILEAVLPQKCHKRASILKLSRAYSELIILAKLKMHNGVTLEMLEDILNRLKPLAIELAPVLKTSLTAIKPHFVYQHLIASIKAKGPAPGTDTGMGEARHPQLKRYYAKTNKQPASVLQQITDKYRRQEVVDRIVERIEVAKQQKREPVIPTRKMGSPEKQCTLSKLQLQIPRGHPKPSGTNIIDSLRAYLYHGIERLQSRAMDKMPALHNWKVRPYKMAYVPYVSLLDNSDGMDRIRATTAWFGQGERNDFVLINFDNKSLRCAQILRLFTILDNDDEYPTAFIRLHHPMTRRKATRFITCKEGDEYRFIPLFSIIRSVHVHPPDVNYEDRYIINDTIDADMYLRLDNIK